MTDPAPWVIFISLLCLIVHLISGRMWLLWAATVGLLLALVMM